MKNVKLLININLLSYLDILEQIILFRYLNKDNEMQARSLNIRHALSL